MSRLAAASVTFIVVGLLVFSFVERGLGAAHVRSRSSRKHASSDGVSYSLKDHRSVSSHGKRRRICLVTKEFPSVTLGGNAWLAEVFASAENNVTVLLVDEPRSNVSIAEMPFHLRDRGKGVRLEVLSQHMLDNDFVPLSDSPKILDAFRVYQWLKENQDGFDVVMYPAWSGIGFYAARAKHQGTEFEKLTLAVSLHGPLPDGLKSQRLGAESIHDLYVDFLERESVTLADVVVAPSQDVVDYLSNQRGWKGLSRRVFVPSTARSDHAPATDRALQSGAVAARTQESTEAIQQEYVEWLARMPANSRDRIKRLFPKQCHSATPVVSVVVPTYNRGRLLLEAVESALSQTCRAAEVLVVDDASTSEEQLDAIEVLKQSPAFEKGKLRVVRQRENAYLGATRNLGVLEARAPLVFFLDDDDLLFDVALETMLSILLKTGADVVATSPVMVTEGSASLRVEHWLVPGGPLLAGLFRNAFSGSTFLIKKSCFLELTTMDGGVGFSERREGYEDWEFHGRARLAGLKFEKTVEPLFFYRTTGHDSMFNTLNRREAMMHATRPLAAALSDPSANQLKAFSDFADHEILADLRDALAKGQRDFSVPAL